MDDDVREMARRRFGFGRWSAPYWFIGLEEATASDDMDGLLLRERVWSRLGENELDDCPEFHRGLGETSWHRTKPRLQPTWRPLMLMLMSFTGRPTDRETLREYQRDKWGTLDGETCIVELSGLAAPGLGTKRDRSFVNDRIPVIRERLHAHRPMLVVMYGFAGRENWEKLAGRRIPDDCILTEGPTILALAKHPASRGMTNNYWTELAERCAGAESSSILPALAR
jgi:hypothetical protein